jgi:hypothetical protein
VHQQKSFGTSYNTFVKGKKRKKKKKLKQITTSQIIKKKIEVGSFALIVKESDMLNLNVLIQGLKEMTLKKKISMNKKKIMKKK